MNITVVIAGPAKAGKTTVAQILNRVLREQGHNVTVEDDSIPPTVEEQRQREENCPKLRVHIRTVGTAIEGKEAT